MESKGVDIMENRASFWKPVLIGGLGIIAVLTFTAFVGEPFTGTCMFILSPFFVALAASYPILRTERFGAGMAAYLPYALLGFIPLYIFDYLQSHALKGLWAVVVWSATGPFIGLCADAAFHISSRLAKGVRAAIVGAVVQAATFVVMLLGLTLLYVDPSAADSHARLFDTTWYFTAPWMVLNGAFGGYTAHALVSRARSAAVTSLPRGTIRSNKEFFWRCSHRVS
jgi:hypothetical protein